jgi:hypothetical protein
MWLASLPLDLKIEIGKLTHVEKFKQVTEELHLKTRHVWAILSKDRHFITDKIRPVFFTTEIGFRAVSIIIESQSFEWAMCTKDTSDIVENEVSVAGPSFEAVKAYVFNQTKMTKHQII